MKRKLVRQNRRIFAATRAANKQAGRRTGLAGENNSHKKVVYEKGLWAWRCIEIAGFAIAIWALLETVEANQLTRTSLEETRKEAEQNRIVNAWQILTTPAPGNSGKKEALATLHKAGEILQAIDLSCKSMGGYDNIDKNCKRRVYLDNLQVSGAELHNTTLDEAYLRYAKFDNVNFYDGDLQGAELWFASFKNADLRRSSFIRSDLTAADFSEANLDRVDFTNAFLLGINWQNTRLRQANISGANFCRGGIILDDPDCAKNLTQGQIDEAWAWKDHEPKFEYQGLKLNLTLPPSNLCNPALRAEYERNQKLGKPKNC